MARWVAHLAHFVIAVSQAAAEKAHQAGIPQDRIAVIRSVVESERFAPPPDARRWAREQLGLPADAFAVVGVGRMVAGKGFEELLEAVALMSSDERPFLLLAGEGPLRVSLEQEAAQRRINEWVRFLGFQADVRPILWAADVFTHVPTTFPEGTPNAILEAMAAGLPVISTPIGGIPEVVREGETGLLVPPNDPEALAEAILKLRQDEALRSELGKGAQKWVQEHHDVRQLPEKVIQVYNRVTAEIFSARQEPHPPN